MIIQAIFRLFVRMGGRHDQRESGNAGGGFPRGLYRHANICLAALAVFSRGWKHCRRKAGMSRDADGGRDCACKCGEEYAI